MERFFLHFTFIYVSYVINIWLKAPNEFDGTNICLELSAGYVCLQSQIRNCSHFAIIKTPRLW